VPRLVQNALVILKHLTLPSRLNPCNRYLCYAAINHKRASRLISLTSFSTLCLAAAFDTADAIERTKRLRYELVCVDLFGSVIVLLVGLRNLLSPHLASHPRCDRQPIAGSGLERGCQSRKHRSGFAVVLMIETMVAAECGLRPAIALQACRGVPEKHVCKRRFASVNVLITYAEPLTDSLGVVEGFVYRSYWANAIFRRGSRSYPPLEACYHPSCIHTLRCMRTGFRNIC
jgi:hypothetical protein